VTPIIKPPVHPPVRRPSQLSLGETAAVVAFGANLGDREATIRRALADLDTIEGITVTRVSRLLESVAVKPEGEDPDAPGYLNGVALLSTTLSPRALLAELNRVEREHGRVRTERWGDRTLDLDIIAFGTLTVDEPDLTIPHPRAAERDFVLAPWLDVDPDAALPGLGRVDALLAALRKDRT
jgi:2-amino-4-hydroxy-6-hydroxymethyldihydropteridine diphosphokinase